MEKKSITVTFLGMNDIVLQERSLKQILDLQSFVSRNDPKELNVFLWSLTTKLVDALKTNVKPNPLPSAIHRLFRTGKYRNYLKTKAFNEKFTHESLMDSLTLDELQYYSKMIDELESSKADGKKKD